MDIVGQMTVSPERSGRFGEKSAFSWRLWVKAGILHAEKVRLILDQKRDRNGFALGLTAPREYVYCGVPFEFFRSVPWLSS